MTAKNQTEFDLSELITTKPTGERKTNFETFTFGKESFSKVRGAVDRLAGRKFETKKAYATFAFAFVLQKAGATKEDIRDFIANNSK